MVGQMMIGDSLHGSAIVRTFIYLASISIDNQDPRDHWQELFVTEMWYIFQGEGLATR
jgi:hypothetical protein